MCHYCSRQKQKNTKKKNTQKREINILEPIFNMFKPNVFKLTRVVLDWRTMKNIVITFQPFILLSAVFAVCWFTNSWIDKYNQLTHYVKMHKTTLLNRPNYKFARQVRNMNWMNLHISFYFPDRQQTFTLLDVYTSIPR